MLDDLFDFDEIRVTSKRPESREEFARRLTEHLGKPVKAVSTPEEALVGALLTEFGLSRLQVAVVSKGLQQESEETSIGAMLEGSQG